MLLQYFKYAFRNIIRHRGCTLINLAGLGVGLAFALLVLFWVRYEYSVDKHHENLDQLYLVAFSCNSDEFKGEYTVGALAPYLRDTYPDITHSSRYASAPPLSLEYEGKKFTSRGRFVDPDFLTMFTFKFIESSPENALESPLSIVITRGLAQKYFSDDEAVGKALKVDENLSLMVTAVIDDPPATSRFQFEFLLSCAIDPMGFSNWENKFLLSYVMLSSGADPSIVSEKISEVYNDHNPKSSPNYQYLFPLRDYYLHGLQGDGRIYYVRLFSVLAIIVLLIACINFMNLSTARATTRYREIGVKKALGARREQLAIQFLIETSIITLAAAIIALILVEILLPGLNSIAQAQVEFDFSWSTIGLLLAVVIGTALLAGCYSAFYLSSFRPASILGGSVTPFESGRSGRGKRFRQTLVVLQFAASIALILGTIGIFGQISYIHDMNVGFNKENLVIGNLPRPVIAHAATIKTKLLNNPDIENVTVSAYSLIHWQSSVGIDWEGKDPGNTFDVGRNWVDYDFANTFQIEMIEGRFFSAELPSDKKDALVVNEACVRAMGMTDPIGRKITISPNSSTESVGTIIGVIRDHHTESAHTRVRPFIYSYTEKGSYMCVRIKPENIGSTLSYMRQTMSEVAPDARVHFRFYDDMTSSLYKDETLTGVVVIYVTLIAIFISCLGLYGLSTYLAMQRAKEVSIRRVLGASVSSIVYLFSREFLVLIIVACLIACPFAWYSITKWLEGFAFRMTMGPGMHITAIVIACLIVTITVSGQAYRAATRNPADTLHQE